MGKAIPTCVFHILCGIETKSGKPIPNKNLFQLSPGTSIPGRKPKESPFSDSDISLERESSKET